MIVPREPTQAMSAAAEKAIDDYYAGDSLRHDEVGRVYRAMIAAHEDQGSSVAESGGSRAAPAKSDSDGVIDG